MGYHVAYPGFNDSETYFVDAGSAFAFSSTPENCLIAVLLVLKWSNTVLKITKRIVVRLLKLHDSF